MKYTTSLVEQPLQRCHSCPENSKGTTVVEISVLMCFPHQALIFFTKPVDDKVKEVAIKKGPQDHGGNIVQVTTDKVRADTSFKTEFDMSATVNSVFAEFLCKLCNTHLAELLDSYEQIQLLKSGSASLAGQNLRDSC